MFSIRSSEGAGHVEDLRRRGGSVGIDRVVRGDDRDLGASDPSAVIPQL